MKGQWSKLFVVTVAFLLLAGACVAAATPLPHRHLCHPPRLRIPPPRCKPGWTR